MKKLLSLVIALSLLIPNLASTLVYAKGNNQYATNTHSHDYSYSFTMSDVHPHSGNVECECGDVVSSTSMINEDCDICRKFLCEQGYHYYLASVHLEDLCYGKCYCGKISYINSDEEKFELHSSHMDEGAYYSSCVFCQMYSNYYENYFNYLVQYALVNEGSNNSSYSSSPTTDSISHTGSSHDEYPAIVQSLSHPHKGYLECSCGLHLYFDESVHSDCEKCLNESGIKNISSDSDIYDYILSNLSGTWQKPIPEEIYYDISDDDYTKEDSMSFSSYKCTLNNSEHDFTDSVSYALDHPHSGYATCDCGEKLYFKYHYLKDCKECRNELCNLGVHDFSAEIHYDDSSKKVGYGKCVCGETLDFNNAVLRYKNLGFDNSQESFSIPCAECTFKSIFNNELVSQQVKSLQNTDIISSIYTGNDISYAYKHYADIAKYRYSVDCSHSERYLEEAPVIVSLPEESQSNDFSTTTTPSKSTSSNNSKSNNNNQTTNTPNSSTDNYYESVSYDDEEYIPTIEFSDIESDDKLGDFLDQFFLGNYAQKTTLAGTIGEIAFSITGLDVYKDFFDLHYNITHWENSWSHVGSTLLNFAAVLPVVGIFKQSDEAAMLYKLSKVDPSLIKVLKQMGGVNANALLKIKKLSTSDIYKLATKTADAHAFTKHLGGTTQSALLALRRAQRNKNGAISCFYSLNEALDIMQTALNDTATAAKVAYGMSKYQKFAVDFNIGKVTGTHMAAGSKVVNQVTGVRIVFKELANGDFYIYTAYPIP